MIKSGLADGGKEVFGTWIKRPVKARPEAVADLGALIPTHYSRVARYSAIPGVIVSRSVCFTLLLPMYAKARICANLAKSKRVPARTGGLDTM